MICIYRRLQRDNNFVDFPNKSTKLSLTDQSPMNQAYSHRFALSYVNGANIPDDAVIKQNPYYNDLLYEIEL